MTSVLSGTADLLAVPPAREAALRALAVQLKSGMRVALSTHINADGDGCGSEAGMAHLLRQLGIDAHVVNPTPWPDMYRFMLDGGVVDESPRGADALKRIDGLIVLDISDVKRLGVLAESVRALRVPKMVIDHHIATDEPAGSVAVSDTAACATGELVFDFARVLGLELTPEIGTALYAAILTDTGGFRFSNTSPRCHAIAGQLLATGVDPEEMYRRVYASVPVGKLALLREALGTLDVDAARGLAWISVPAGAMERHNVRAEDLDGIVEHPRSIAGTRLALFFRDLGHNRVKVSFRSTGEVDVNALAREFGGGGHAKASGALIAGSLDDVEQRVVDASRAYLDSLSNG
ncbi:phosphoesterase RecJ domain protein [Gemmatirosa kalamazoonensis]|uniref:Phosphoesterase RecJ domain protein n=1 Tax=Gemmatirosa kalamazoonensis TaxID=861299 RepID=W0RPN1_9BACT|nr:bifunctional oligoribonuclease/PAP phosphatase NrnA [Gemmatirosa kalamazoonensis]AHG91453.1 phosphoesterase RecJ domain protein [Gemmatirosa kalamazoonensis]